MSLAYRTAYSPSHRVTTPPLGVALTASNCWTGLYMMYRTARPFSCSSSLASHMVIQEQFHNATYNNLFVVMFCFLFEQCAQGRSPVVRTEASAAKQRTQMCLISDACYSGCATLFRKTLLAMYVAN